MSVFSSSAFDHHELVAFHCDPGTGLRAIIAVHDSSLGAGVGGCRMYPYADDEAALEDVLRLSRGMTYKSALAGLPFGGGKSVIIGNPAQDKTPDFLRAMGDFIHAQGGRYVAAEDSGTGVDDIRIMHERTPYVSGIDDNEFGGDPSPHTAFGVYLGILTAVQHRLGQDNLTGLSVAVQGLGHVGYHLARLLVRAGANVVAADMNDANLARAVRELGVEPVAVEDILYQAVDVLAPCAMGAVLNQQTIPRIRAGIVAGAANNQLATIDDGADLQGRGILYCPDFLINAGGIIDVYHQRMGSADRVKQEHILGIRKSLAEVLRRAAETQGQTHLIAEALAMEQLRTHLSATTNLAA
jgi:leucine dehydrogenase